MPRVTRVGDYLRRALGVVRVDVADGGENRVGYIPVDDLLGVGGAHVAETDDAQLQLLWSCHVMSLRVKYWLCAYAAALVCPLASERVRIQRLSPCRDCRRAVNRKNPVDLPQFSGKLGMNNQRPTPNIQLLKEM